MSRPDLTELPARLQRCADLLRLSGESDFKAIAYEKAAAVVEAEGENLRFRTSETALQELPNIGKSIAADLKAYLDSGTLPTLESLEKSIPAGLLSWLGISGLGPKRAAKIHKALEIIELDDLRAALSDGRVAALPGFGKKSAEKLLEALAWTSEHMDRCLAETARDLAAAVENALRSHPGLERLETAGSLRRRAETIGDIDVLAVCENDTAGLHKRFRDMEGVVEILAAGDTKSSVRVQEGRQIDLRTVAAAEFPAAWLYFTGSKEHNVFLRGRAREKGLTLNEYGLFPLVDGEADREHPLDCPDEAAIYAALDLPFVPPELREAPYEARIKRGDLPAPLQPEHLRGILHAHSTWSDGKNTLEDMARATHRLGYDYLGITDHSRSSAVANGLSIERVEAQWREIDTLNQRFNDEGLGFRILKGIECDILPDGSLDYPDDILAGFELVIASLHSSLDQEAAAMQARVEAALHHPAVTLLGHATARRLLRRKSAALDMEQTIRLAAKLGKAIELNCSPDRMELDWRWGPLAAEVGLKSAVCPDAHSADALANITRLGIPLARKAGFTPDRLLNCGDPESW